MTTRNEALKAKLEEMKAIAIAKALSPEEAERASLAAQIQKEVEAAAMADAARRADDLVARVESAEKVACGAYLVAGVDLVAFFPIGKAPPATHFPNGGVIVVRNPKMENVDTVSREYEHRKLTHSQIAIDLLCSCVVDPPESAHAERVTLGEFCNRYPDAAAQAAGKARELGGARAQAEAKRGQ